MSDKKYDFGMVGLGVMGKNLLLNIADHGFTSMGLDQDTKKVAAVNAVSDQVSATTSPTEFVASLKVPRKIMMLVPAGAPVDSVISELVPLLDKGDLLIDGGNSYFPDTDRRYQQLSEKGIHFMGVGISGGEEGARRGPSIMPGGNKESYALIKPIFEAAAAKINNEPCVTFIGNRSAGNYVKMVHNGIEYAIMQLISESYHLLKAIGLSDEELKETYQTWSNGELNSFLMEITADIFAKKDDDGALLVNKILDRARQKGTGKWTSQNAMDLQVPAPTIDMAVVGRDISALKEERVAADKLFEKAVHVIKQKVDKKEAIEKVRKGLIFSYIISYAQGFAMITKASETYEYNVNLEEVAKIWRGGCIIRATMLEDFRKAFARNAHLKNIMVDPELSKKLAVYQQDIRECIKIGVDLQVPLSAMMASLSYFDLYKSGWLPLNLIQAQRDYFGAHTYERIDRDGFFHTQWK